MKSGYLVLESGETFKGDWLGGNNRAGEIVFNTSHSGYEEIATDPSYFGQIMVMSSSQQGNYSVSDEVWESDNIWINGFLALEIQNGERDNSWVDRLSEKGVPVMHKLDTRRLILKLRDEGTPMGAVVTAESEIDAKAIAEKLITEQRKIDKDWVYATTCKSSYEVDGDMESGPRVAIIDYGAKKNIVRELKKRCSALKVFPSRVSSKEVLDWKPHGIMLSNGPGDPADVEIAVDTVKEMLGQLPIFGICMGHHILCLALGAKTYKLKFGHRGSNQPVKDHLLDQVYITSQNHGYAVVKESLPSNVTVSHTHLNDQTISGISCLEKKCMSVQFHPESHPGPRDAEGLFDYFVKQMQ